MGNFRLRSAAEQVAAHLRSELAGGVWREEMPGESALAKGLGVNPKTVQAAISLLVRDGLLESQGERKPRRIRQLADTTARRSLRVGMLLGDAFDRKAEYITEVHHQLSVRGHAPFFVRKTLSDLGQDAGRMPAGWRRWWIERRRMRGWWSPPRPR